ncbi:hypothetical protein RRG08_048192 [Elysia crispata]|uniref:Uncharacterized protein n=1 Tax=Elysia crispata TaxID=231223 RepID=A0AAE0ZVD1_9GAST|nr:hypothetical protein RRG08_048192 [Elysia crispata]
MSGVGYKLALKPTEWSAEVGAICQLPVAFAGCRLQHTVSFPKESCEKDHSSEEKVKASFQYHHSHRALTEPSPRPQRAFSEPRTIYQVGQGEESNFINKTKDASELPHNRRAPDLRVCAVLGRTSDLSSGQQMSPQVYAQRSEV